MSSKYFDSIKLSHCIVLFVNFLLHRWGVESLYFCYGAHVCQVTSKLQTEQSSYLTQFMMGHGVGLSEVFSWTVELNTIKVVNKTDQKWELKPRAKFVNPRMTNHWRKESWAEERKM